MSKIKKVLAFAAAMVMLSGTSAALTAAYLTDRDSEANVFTVGDVQIELSEEFDAGSAILVPGVDIEKEAKITNTGKNDAWVWAEIAIPTALDDPDASRNVVHFNYARESVEAGKWNWKKDGSWNTRSEKIGEIDYTVYTVLYDTVLKPGGVTESVMTKVYMDPHIDINTNGDWWWVENGAVSGKDGKPYWNSEKAPIMYVSAYAIQAEGFGTALAGYEAYRAQWADKGTEWGEVTAAPGEGDKEQGPLKYQYEIEELNGFYSYILSCDKELVSGEGEDYYYDPYSDWLEIYTSEPVMLSMGDKAGGLSVVLYSGCDLTLNNVTISCTGNRAPLTVASNQDAVIRLVGKNKLENTDLWQPAVTVGYNSALTITSDCGGELTAKGQAGLNAIGNGVLTLSGNAKVHAEGYTPVAVYSEWNSTLEIKDSATLTETVIPGP